MLYTKALTDGMANIAKAHGIGLATEQVGGMFGLFFTEQDKVTRFDQVMACDTEAYSRFFHGMLAAGVYFAPSAFEAGFVSTTHYGCGVGLYPGGGRQGIYAVGILGRHCKTTVLGDTTLVTRDISVLYKFIGDRQCDGTRLLAARYASQQNHEPGLAIYGWAQSSTTAAKLCVGCTSCPGLAIG